VEHSRIGIVWVGDPQMLNDATRSMPLRHLVASAERHKGSLISLQNGEAEQQLYAVVFGRPI